MIPEILAAFYLQGGGALEHSVPDQLSDHHPHVMTEGRYQIAVGFEFPLNRYLSFDMGYRYQDPPPIIGMPDSEDRVQQLYATVRYRPFAR